MRALLLTVGLLAGVAWADVPRAPPPAEAAAQHPEGIEKSMGVIEGGWEYVYAAYSVAFIGVVGFALSLFIRRPKQQGTAS